MRSGFLLVFLVILSVLSPPPSAQARVRAGDCAATLACTAEQINTMTMAERLAFLRSISPSAAPGYAPHWGTIEGVLEFFADRGLGKPGSWISYVDAGDLEAIERGAAIAEARGTDTYGNQGAVLWASYLLLLRSGELNSRSAHDRAWSQAEQASVDDGVLLAEQAHGLNATPVEQRFFKFTEFYRWVLRARPELLDLYLGSAPITPGKTLRQQKFLDWFTDVTIDEPAHAGAALGYDVAAFDGKAGVADLVQVLKAYITYYIQG